MVPDLYTSRGLHATRAQGRVQCDVAIYVYTGVILAICQLNICYVKAKRSYIPIATCYSVTCLLNWSTWGTVYAGACWTKESFSCFTLRVWNFWQNLAQYYDVQATTAVATTAEGVDNCVKMDFRPILSGCGLKLSLAIGISCACLVSYDRQYCICLHVAIPLA